MCLVVVDQALQGVVGMVVMMLLLRTTVIGMGLRNVSFRDVLLLLVLMRAVTFPLVLEEKSCRRRRGLVVLNGMLLVDYGFVMAFLMRVRRREDTYGNRDASVKVQDASLSDSP